MRWISLLGTSMSLAFPSGRILMPAGVSSRMRPLMVVVVPFLSRRSTLSGAFSWAKVWAATMPSNRASAKNPPIRFMGWCSPGYGRALLLRGRRLQGVELLLGRRVLGQDVLDLLQVGLGHVVVLRGQIEEALGDVLDPLVDRLR